MPQEPSRLYNMDDDVMLTEGERFKRQLEERLGVFTPKFKMFTSEYVSEMQDDIDLCKASTSDAICVGLQHLQTEAVEAAVGVGRVDLQNVYVYVRQAFPGNKAMLKAFGQNKYDSYRRSALKMPKLLMQAYNMASNAINKALLIEKGLTQVDITKLKTDSMAIDSAVQKQEDLMGARSLTTQARIINLNVVYSKMVEISDSAKQLYKDNAAEYKLFVLYHPPHTPPDEPIPPVDPPVPE